MTRRSREARRGEERAPELLRRAGYRVEAAQVEQTYTLQGGGESITITVRADYLVRRRGKRFVAEVKTGQLAPRLTTAATRRQLLEYERVYDVDGVLLIDMTREAVLPVSFGAAPRGPARVTPFLLGLLSGVLLAWWGAF